MAAKAPHGLSEMFRLKGRRRHSSQSMTSACSNKRGSRRQQRHQRDAKTFGYWRQLEAPVRVGSTAMVDPPRQLLVSRVSLRRVDRGAVLDGLQTALIVVDQSGVITQARAGRSGDQKL